MGPAYDLRPWNLLVWTAEALIGVAAVAVILTGSRRRRGIVVA